MAAETRYPTRRRSSRQSSQQNASDTTATLPEPVTSMSLRARSNISQSATAAETSVTAQLPAATRSVNHSATAPSNAFSNLPKTNSTPEVEEQRQPIVDPVMASTSEYRREDKNKVLWYATPPVNVAPLPQPVHSAKYLYWKRIQNEQQKAS